VKKYGKNQNTTLIYYWYVIFKYYVIDVFAGKSKFGRRTKKRVAIGSPPTYRSRKMNREEEILEEIADLRQQIADFEREIEEITHDMLQEVWTREEEIEELTAELEDLTDDPSS
jgi:hypothetical protein